MSRIIIIGGGYAGTLLARTLDTSTEVVLVEPRDGFVHNVAAIRAMVAPALLDRIILPYGKLLKRGRVVRERVTAIHPGGVTLSDGTSLEGDAVVLATGSSYALPFKSQSDETDGFRALAIQAAEAVKDARSIAIAGAGAVGVELAGEIAAAANGKRVTLIADTPSLFPAFNPGLGRTLQRQLNALGVHVIHGHRAKGLASLEHPLPGPLQLDNGQSVEADLVIPATGARPSNALAKTIAGARFDRLGRIAVDPWLRVEGHKSLFALGDVAATAEAMTIVAISRQAPWLAKTVLRALAGQTIELLPAYTPWKVAPILLPLGARRGASVLPFGRNGLVVGSYLTSQLKGKELFIPRYRREFGCE